MCACFTSLFVSQTWLIVKEIANCVLNLNHMNALPVCLLCKLGGGGIYKVKN